MAAIIGLKPSRNLCKNFRSGALMWARKQLPLRGHDGSSLQEAAKTALALARDDWPLPWMTGAAHTGQERLPDDDDRYLPKYHWPQYPKY